VGKRHVTPRDGARPVEGPKCVPLSGACEALRSPEIEWPRGRDNPPVVRLDAMNSSAPQQRAKVRKRNAASAERLDPEIDDRLRVERLDRCIGGPRGARPHRGSCGLRAWMMLCSASGLGPVFGLCSAFRLRFPCGLRLSCRLRFALGLRSVLRVRHWFGVRPLAAAVGVVGSRSLLRAGLVRIVQVATRDVDDDDDLRSTEALAWPKQLLPLRVESGGGLGLLATESVVVGKVVPDRTVRRS
jgi:hypothetical protein